MRPYRSLISDAAASVLGPYLRHGGEIIEAISVKKRVRDSGFKTTSYQAESLNENGDEDEDEDEKTQV